VGSKLFAVDREEHGGDSLYDRERTSATLAIFPLNDDEISALQVRQRIPAPLAEVGIIKPTETAVALLALPLHVLVRRLSEVAALRDISVVEPDIEDVVARLYKERMPAPRA
jgi:hypothetical protein